MNKVILHQRNECLLHESVLAQGALLLFLSLGNFLQNVLVFCIQSGPWKSFLWIAFFWGISISFSWKTFSLVLHGISFWKNTSWSGFFFLSANPSSCSCLWVFVNLFHFWKEFSLIAELFKGNKHMLIDFSQWSLVQSYSLDIHHSKCFISQWFWKRIKEGSLDIHIIHAIDSIKSPWHLIKMSF